LAKFINKRSEDDADDTSDGRVIYFSKTPGQPSKKAERQAESQSNKTEFAKLIKGQEGDIFSSPDTQNKTTTITRLFEDEKKELNNIQKLITKQSQSLDKAKRIFKEKQLLIEKELNKKSSMFSGDKFTIVGQLSSKMAHDIRNPLNVIKVQVDLLKLRYSKQEDTIMLDSLERMEKAVHGITNQLNDVLNFLKDSPVQLEKTSLRTLVTESILYVQVPDNISFDLPQNDATVMCDKNKIERVIVNMIQNSIQAMEQAGKITFVVSEDEHKTNLQIQDTGSGIPDDVMQKIFEPLFTTKHNGTGLGLPICKKIVEDHGGKISVTNNPTTFTITLPK